MLNLFWVRVPHSTTQPKMLNKIFKLESYRVTGNTDFFQVIFVSENKVWSRKINLTTYDLWVWHKSNMRDPCSDRNILYCDYINVNILVVILYHWGKFCIILQLHVILQLSQNRKFSLKMLMINIRKISTPIKSIHITGEKNQ